MDNFMDPSRELDVLLFDRVVIAFYTGAGTEQAQAQQLLTQFQDHPDAWQNVPAILRSSNEVQSKFIALNILSNLIVTQWKILPPEQTRGIRNFIIGIILKHSEDEATLRQSKTYLAKLNITLVQILKQEWPHNWPEFIPEIVASSRSSEALCENNMAILKLLFEEIFDAGDQMTQEKSKALQNSLHAQFSQVFDLCLEALERSANMSLLSATLETVARCLWWIGPDYVYNTQLLDLLLNKYLAEPALRKITIKCLLEISRLPAGTQHQGKIQLIFTSTLHSISSVIPATAQITDFYANSTDYDQQTLFQFALFLATFLAKHHRLIETQENIELMQVAHTYLLHFVRINEREIFKICLEYWHILVTSLYIDMALQRPADDISVALSGLQVDDKEAGLTPDVVRQPRSEIWKTTYTTLLTDLREVIVDKMVKPAEVLIVQNEDGEIVRERLRESETVAMYKTTRDILIYLTHLDTKDTLMILTRKLAGVMSASELLRPQLNSLCWAIGAISGTMREDAERIFIIEVVKHLLVLCDSKTDRDDRAIVASDLMYVVGQYPRFLKSNWKFLKVFIDKLFEFMNEPHEGVREMACETFMKIAYKRRRDFVVVQPGESQPFVYSIIELLPAKTGSVSTLHAQMVYESVGHMIFAQTSAEARTDLINTLMERPNQQWRSLMSRCTADNYALLDYEDQVNQAIRILKINASVSSAIGETFVFQQLTDMLADTMELYRESSKRIDAAIATNGEVAAAIPKVRYLKKLKKAIINLLETSIRRCENAPSPLATCSLPFFDIIIPLYGQESVLAREPDIFGSLNILYTKAGFMLRSKIDQIYKEVLEPTLAMIVTDFSSFLDHRMGYYKLLRSINRGSFNSFMDMESDQLSYVMDSVIWGMKHTTRDIADLALTFCLELFNNMAQYEGSYAQVFFKSFFIKVLDEAFFVMTDSNHRCSFTFQSALVGRLFHIVQTNRIRVPLADTSDPTFNNRISVPEHCLQLLGSAFPHTSRHHLDVFIRGLCEHHSNLGKIKAICRDFVIQLKEFSGDNSELFVEDKLTDTGVRPEPEAELAGLVQKAHLDDDDDEEL